MLLTPNRAPEGPKFFGRRIGRRIRKTKAELLKAALPAVRVSEINEDIFGRKVKEFHLEVGFGDGQHLAGQARNNPDIGYIGAEVFQNGVVHLLELMAENNLQNIRIFDEDMRLLFPKIPNNFFSRIYVLFPDPWPKKRHAYRRFINPENLDELSRILKPGGLLRIATDHKIYKSWALRRMNEREDFRWTAKTSNDWRNEPEGWVRTKYQEKALREGRKPVFLDYEKI